MSNENSGDFTPGGLKIEGHYENSRNAKNSDLFKDMIREAYGAGDVIIAHHLTYVKEETREDGFKYQVVEEIPSADTLIFDVEAAKKIWGSLWRINLQRLSMLPVPSRDEVLRQLYYSRSTG